MSPIFGHTQQHYPDTFAANGWGRFAGQSSVGRKPRAGRTWAYSGTFPPLPPKKPCVGNGRAGRLSLKLSAMKSAQSKIKQANDIRTLRLHFEFRPGDPSLHPNSGQH